MPSKQNKPDLSGWNLSDVFSINEAACLWVGLDPATPASDRSKDEISKFTPILRWLSEAVENGLLPTDSSRNLFENQGDHLISRVTRSDLVALANSKGQKPPFLFDAEQPTDEAIGLPEPQDQLGAKAKPGRPAKCPKEYWLERLAILALQQKCSMNDSLDAIAAALSEDLSTQGITVEPSTIKRDWIGSMIRTARGEFDHT